MSTALAHEYFAKKLTEWPIVHILVSLNHTGVRLPDSVKDASVTGFAFLDFGLNTVKPINDLVITAGSVSATLSFNNTPHPVLVPWNAVGVIIDPRTGENAVVNRDVLTAFRAKMADTAKRVAQRKREELDAAVVKRADHLVGALTKKPKLKPAWLRGVIKGGKCYDE
jgi:hypothetical protein